MLEYTTVVKEVDRFLRNHPGQKSRISTKALLLGMVLAAYETGRYLRSDVCSFLNGLDYRLGVELGLWTWDTRHPITYTMTQKQIKRLETAIFEAHWSSDGQPRSINWFMDTFLTDTIPPHARKAIIAVSLDWTPMPTWAVTRDYRIEEEIRKAQEPEDTGEIGTLNLRDRAIRSADGDALGGHLTATNKTPAGGFTGYYGHIIIPARGATWNGNPNNLTLGVLPPKYVPHGRAIPAQNDNALNGLNAALVALDTFPNLKEIIADRGYTIYGKDFVRPLHQMGINVVMDYKNAHQKTIETVTIGPKGEEQVLLLHCGTFLVEWTPERFWIPPQNLKGKKRDDWYAERAKYRWTPIGKPDKNGAIRFRCPQCDGRVKTNAKTRISQQKIPTQSTLRHHHRPGILLQRHPNHPRRKTRHLPAHPLRHSRLEKTVRPTDANREPQQPRQKRRRPQRRLVPGTRPSRLQLRTPRSANRSQPTPTQQLRPRQRRKTRQRTATHPHHQPPPVHHTQ